jgi:hypothetical protein
MTVRDKPKGIGQQIARRRVLARKGTPTRVRARRRAKGESQGSVPSDLKTFNGGPIGGLFVCFNKISRKGGKVHLLVVDEWPELPPGTPQSVKERRVPSEMWQCFEPGAINAIRPCPFFSCTNAVGWGTGVCRYDDESGRASWEAIGAVFGMRENTATAVGNRAVMKTGARLVEDSIESLGSVEAAREHLADLIGWREMRAVFKHLGYTSNDNDNDEEEEHEDENEAEESAV